jgi:hypothetical protein
VHEDPPDLPTPSPVGRPSVSFRFGRGRGQKSENERIHFAKRNEASRLACRKSLKSLCAANHDFAGLFVFNGLSATFRFAIFSHAVGAVSKADRQPDLSEQTARILYFRLIIQRILF